jgi:SNF2 family DNA or RNA helicase
LAEKNRERVLTLVTRLKSTFRWCLSGTPRHGNFNDIQRLASLLGTHLGVDESLPGAKFTKVRQVGKETTGLESLSHFLEVRSMQWHERRHRLGQEFLDRFVRQNIAEIDEIAFEEHKVYIDLPAVERAIYLELETVLESLDNKIANALKSKNKSTGDREHRMQRMLQDSGSAEEALLKCCSHFNMSSESSTALKTISDIIAFRKEQQADLKKSMIKSLISAYRQRQRIINEQPDWATVSRAETGEVVDALIDYEKLVERRDSVPHGADDEVHILIEKMLKTAQRAFQDNPDRIDQSFVEVNDGDDESTEDSRTSDRSDSESRTPKQIRAMKVALRDHLHLVRSSSQELCGRIRSLRYIEWIRRFQKNETDFQCSKCAKQGLDVDEVGVLSKCGHVGCLECLKTEAVEGKCINAPFCSALVSCSHVVSSSDFGLEHEDSSGGQYGRKLTAVVEKVKEIIHQDDRIIVFCQFNDLKDKVRKALTEAGVASLQVEGNVQRQVKALSIFQKAKPAKNDPRVLVLKMDDEQSAGLNLTNLNHAIFVHPLFANNQQEYDAHETQAIGRIRRFGQIKKVHVWRFLARNTIDTKIFDERSSHMISATTTNSNHSDSQE